MEYYSNLNPTKSVLLTSIILKLRVFLIRKSNNLLAEETLLLTTSSKVSPVSNTTTRSLSKVEKLIVTSTIT